MPASSVAPSSAPGRVAVLASGSGSNLQALLDHPELAGAVVRVVSDVPGAGALERAARAGVPHACVPRSDHGDRTTWERALADEVAGAEPDIVVLAGFMRILSGAFVARWPILNVHPSLLPAFPGAHAVEAAVDHGVKVAGATVHLVVEEVDAGPIVAQEAVAVAHDEDADRLHARIQQVEHRILPRAVVDWLAGRLQVDGRHVIRIPDPAA